MERIKPGPGQESVWDYPRPPAVGSVDQRVRVVFNGITVADSTSTIRVLETSHPPAYYIPIQDIQSEHLRSEPQQTFCEFKGQASYWSLVVDGRVAQNAAWGYRNPNKGYEAIKDHLCFYASRVDACYVGDEQVTPQAGDFYGGWITSNVVGPFKGGPGTRGW